MRLLQPLSRWCAGLAMLREHPLPAPAHTVSLARLLPPSRRSDVPPTATTYFELAG
jgi:hypothetical protein